MPHRSSFLSFAVFASLAFTGAATTGACSQQSEGEPCNPSPSADDCGSNLSCIFISANNDGYRCCPPVGSGISPTTSVCSQNNSGINGSNTSASDASTDGEAGATSTDGSTTADAGPEAGPEAAPEAEASSPSMADGGDASPVEASTSDAGDAAVE